MMARTHFLTQFITVNGKSFILPGDPVHPHRPPSDFAYFTENYAVVKNHRPCSDAHVLKTIQAVTDDKLGCPLLFVKSGRQHQSASARRKKPCHRILCLACEQLRQRRHYETSERILAWNKTATTPYGFLTLNAPRTESTSTGGRLANTLQRCRGAIERLNRLGLLAQRNGGPMVSARWRTHVRYDRQKANWVPHVHILFRGTMDNETLERIRRVWRGIWSLRDSGKTHVRCARVISLDRKMWYISRELTPIFVGSQDKARKPGQDREMMALHLATQHPYVLGEYLHAKRILRRKQCLSGFFRPTAQAQATDK